MKLKSSKSLKVCSNMTIRLKLLLGLAVALAVVTGGIVGAIKTQEVEAVTVAKYWFKLPIRNSVSADASLTCSWHRGACGGDNPGRPWATDWDYYAYGGGGGNSYVYLRGHGYDPSSTTKILSWLNVQHRPGEFTGCYNNTIVDLMSFLDNSWQVGVGYTHTLNQTGSGSVVRYNSSYYWNSIQVSTMQTSDNDPWCSLASGNWTGAHVHWYETITFCGCGGLGVASNWAFDTGNPYDVDTTWMYYWEYWY